MSAHGLRQVAWFDCPGGGQVVVDGRVAYIAHMKAPYGTTLVDVTDPRTPRALAGLQVPPGTHSHKVRAANGLMLVNREAQPASEAPPGFAGGLGIWDVSNPEKPREIAFWRCGGARYLRRSCCGKIGNSKSFQCCIAIVFSTNTRERKATDRKLASRQSAWRAQVWHHDQCRARR